MKFMKKSWIPWLILTSLLFVGAAYRANYFPDIIVKGPWLDIRAYSSINAAVSAVGATPKTVYVINNESLTGALTTPSTLHLQFLGGGKITLGAYNLGINGPMSGPISQRFDDSGAGSVSFGTGYVEKGYAEWWGVDATADDVQINAALTALDKVTLLSNIYNLSAAVAIPINKHLEGVGWEKTVLNQTAATYAVTMDANYTSISDLKITGNSSATGGIKIGKTAGTSPHSVKNVYITGLSNGIGIWLDEAFRVELNHVWIDYCERGLLIDENSTFVFDTGAIRTNTNHAIDTTGSYASGYFKNVDISSNTGQVAVQGDASDGGASNVFLIFESCLFENNGGSTANPMDIRYSGGWPLIVKDSKFAPPNTNTTGTIYSIYSSDGYSLHLEANLFVQNAAQAGRTFIYAVGNGVGVSRQQNIFTSTGETIATLEGYITIDSTYPPTMRIDNDIFRGSDGVKAVNSVQTGTTVGIAAMTFKQNDIDKPGIYIDHNGTNATGEIIKIDGASAADDSRNISTMNGDGSVEGPKNYSTQNGWTFQGMVKINVNGTDSWFPYYTKDTS